jgi:hypothetical protein
MAGTRKFFRVFLASPGDLVEERGVAKQVIDEYNSQLADALGYHADLVGWEDTLPGIGRPQALINRDLDGCDLFVGMLWKRWGSPPETSGEFTSGFEEEYVRSMRRFEAEQRPQIHLLLKHIDQASLVDPGDQLKRVQGFRERVFAERKLLAKTFATILDFEQTFRFCIQGYAIALRDQEAASSSEKSEAGGVGSSAQVTAEEAEVVAEAALPAEGITFLQGLMTNLKRGKEFSPSSSDVARFRLLSLTVGTPGNDEATLGAHDSNLIFKDRKSLRLSRQEQFELLDAGLETFKSQNLPVWHWLRLLDGFKHQVLAISSIVGSSSSRQLGAISAMRVLGQPIHDEGSLTRDVILERWFGKESGRDLRSAALGYLAECGTSADIPRLREELGKNDYQTEKAAVAAILSILEREGADTLFLTLLELRPASVDEKLLRAIFSKSNPPTALLIQALDQRSSDVRQMAAAELRKRRALPLPAAEKLLGDESARVRYEAMQSLISAGRTFSAEEAKSFLIRKTESHPARGLMGLAMLANADPAGESLFEEFTRDQLLALTEDDLVAKAQTANLDQDAFIALARKKPSAYREEVIQALRDRFTARHQAALDRLTNLFGAQSDTVEKVRGLGEFLRQQYTRQALDLIASEQRVEDLALIRDAIRSGFVGYSPVDLFYLKRFGSWEDILPIIASLERTVGGGSPSLLAQINEDKDELAASVIYTLGKDRIDELLGIEMPAQLKIALIRLSTAQQFRTISGARLNELLRAEPVEVRKASALKAIVSFPKKRIADVLEEYHSADQFYYNVIHWLDFGLSVPRSEMLRGAARELADVQ